MHSIALHRKKNVENGMETTPAARQLKKLSRINIALQEAQLSQRGRAMPHVVEYFG